MEQQKYVLRPVFVPEQDWPTFASVFEDLAWPGLIQLSGQKGSVKISLEPDLAAELVHDDQSVEMDVFATVSCVTEVAGIAGYIRSGQLVPVANDNLYGIQAETCGIEGNDFVTQA
jgi:hypothetical protein